MRAGGGITTAGVLVALALALAVASASPGVAQQPGRVDQVQGPRSADGRLLGPDGAPLDDAAVEGLLDTRDAVIGGMETRIDQLEALRRMPRSAKVLRMRGLLEQLRAGAESAEPSVVGDAAEAVFGSESRDWLGEAIEAVFGPSPPPNLNELLPYHPELAIGAGTLGKPALWEALLDDELYEQLTRNPAGLSPVEQDQLLVDLLNDYIEDGLADLSEQVAALESMDRLQDLWGFGAERWDFARRRLERTDPEAAARARAGETAYATRQPGLDYNRALNEHLMRQARAVDGERDDAGRLIDSNGNAISATTVRGLLLVRDMVEAQLHAFADQLDAVRDGPRSAKVDLARELRERARAVRDAHVNLVAYQARATSPYDQRTGRVRGYPKDAYDDLLRRAAAAEARGDADEAARLREEAETGLYGTYRARALEFYRLLDQAPELAIEVDGVRLWEALLDDDFYEQITGRTGLSGVEIDQAFVDLLNTYLEAGAAQARAEADDVAGATQLDELLEFGNPRYTNAQHAAAGLGTALGATLPGDLVAEVQAFHEGFRLTEQYEEALTRGAVDATLTAVAVVATIFVPVLAPAAWQTVAAVQLAWDGTELVVSYLEESEITDEAMRTGHVHILSAEERRRAAEQQFIFTAITSVPDLAAAARAGRVRVEPRAPDAPPATARAAPDGGGEWLTPGGRAATPDDVSAFTRQVAYDDLEEAVEVARQAGVPDEQIDNIVRGLDKTSPELDTYLAHQALEEVTLRRQGFEIVQGFPSDYTDVAAIYARGRQRGGLAPNDHEFLRNKIQEDPGYLETLGRRVAQNDAGEHQILFPGDQAERLREWFAAGPLPPEGVPPVVRMDPAPEGVPPVVRTGEPAGAAAGEAAPRRGPGDTQVLDADETVRVRGGPGDPRAPDGNETGSVRADETVRLPAFDPPPAGPARNADETGSYLDLSTADDYATLVERQAGGEVLDLSEIARPGIARVTPDGDIMIVQGAGRWDNTRPDEYIDIFVDSRTPLPPESGARVIDTDVPAELVRDANLLSSRGAAGSNPRIVNSLTGDTPSFQRVRVPARNVDVAYSDVMRDVGEILDGLRESGVNTARLEEALAPLAPVERLAILQDDAARARAIETGSAAAPDETVRLPAPDLPADETVRLPAPDLPGDETLLLPRPDLPGADDVVPAGRAGEGPVLSPAAELALRGAERAVQTADNLPEREVSGAGPGDEDPARDEFPIGILPPDADRSEDDPVADPRPAGDPNGADPEFPEGEPIGEAPRTGDPDDAGAGGEVADGDAGDGVTTGDPIDYATSVAPIEFTLSPVRTDCGPEEEPGTVVDLINVAAPLINLTPDGAFRNPGSQLVMAHYPATTVAPAGSGDGAPDPGFDAAFAASRRPVFASYTAAGFGSGGTALLEGHRTGPVPAGTASGPPPGDVWIYVRSRGGLGADAVEIRVVNERMEPVRLRGGAVVLEPLVVSDAERIRLERHLDALTVEPPTIAPADAYCLDLQLAPPDEGTVFRVADPETQERHAPAREVMDAARRLRDAGALEPDSDPVEYFHSITQWAIWSLQEGLDAGSFPRALVEHTRRNALAAGLEWGPALERAVLDAAPGRWTDIRNVLGAVGAR